MQSGLMNTFQSGIKTRNWAAWAIAIALFAFYILIYFDYALGILGPVAERLGMGIWTLYGLMYTIAMIIGGIYFLHKHGNSRYHQVRTIVVVLVQIIFAFSIPLVMEIFDSKGFILSLFWPLKIEYFYPQNIFTYPLTLVLYAFLSFVIGVPLLTYFYGKRWYCSWVCGCGGLAETAGDPFRHLSDRKAKAWKFEQWSIHLVMFAAFATTAMVIINWSLHHTSPDGQWITQYPLFDSIATTVQKGYQTVVVAMLSGVIGVGLYPLMGTRVWCRFFCPLAAILGIIQKLGRFRITVKPDMCISCGNCSTYCEMGIDVRQYAQNNQSFKRAACVGCGMCAHVCPRGVLRLENKADLRESADKERRPIVDM